MKKILVIIMMIASVFFTACRNQVLRENSEPTERPFDLSDNKQNGAAEEPITSVDRSRFLDQIEFEQSENNLTDRMGRDAESLLKSFDQDTGGQTAVCIVTLLNLETDQPETDLKIIPAEVRIDRIIKKNDAFALKEGDKFRTTDFSIWEKTGNGFKVRHPSYVPPLTEPGAQYIVFIYYRETNPYFEEIKYLTSPLTIPILRNGEALEDDIYEKMNLDDEARRCSEYLIQTYITDFSNE